MKLTGKVTKVEKTTNGVRVTADCSTFQKDGLGLPMLMARREAFVDIPEHEAAAYPVGRPVKITMSPAGVR